MPGESSRMVSSESPRPPVDAFYVLKQGGMHGPFTREELHARFTAGIFAMEDFVQAEGVPIWQPLARVLGSEDVNPHGAIAPDWKSLVTWAWLRLRFDLDEQSVVAGWACLGIGLVALVLSHWTFVFWLPWMMAALLAALALFQRRRMMNGGALLAAAIGLPLAFFAWEPRPKSAPAPVVEEKVEPPAPRVTPLPEMKLEAAAPPTAALEPAPPVALPEPAPTPAPEPSATPEPGMLAGIKKFFSGLREQPPAPAAAPMPAPILTLAEPAKIPNVAGGGQFVQQHRNALVVVKDRGSSGSGFIAKAGAQTWLFTNIHVAAGMAQPQFTRIDGTQLKPGIAEAAVGHDAMRLALAEPPPESLEILSALDANAKIGDDVLVLGNSGGGGVITSLPGTLVGIGPDRIEVSAEFIPGNSGSPIVHVPSGKVIGIATYLTRRYEAFAGGDAKAGAVVVRRFGFRLDSVKQWQPLNWAAFQNEAHTIEQISAVTGDVFDFLDALRKKQNPTFATATLRRPAETWLATIRRPHLSEADRDTATRSFLTSLRTLVQADVSAAQGRIRYAYFQNELRQEREVRDRLFKAFDDEAKAMSTPQMGRSR